MSEENRSLRIVVLESPYDIIEDQTVQSVFGKLIALKIAGYQAVYPYGVLPVDSYDFVATHYLVCEKKGDQLTPIMGTKTITLDKCDAHNLAFPGLTVFKSSGAMEHAETLQALLNQCKREGKIATYGSSWTIAPWVREDPKLKSTLKDLMGVFLYQSAMSTGAVENFGCGVPQVRTHEFFQTLGYKLLAAPNGKELPSFPQASLMGEHAVGIRCTQWSDHALSLSQRYRWMWNARIEFSAPARKTAVAKKAA